MASMTFGGRNASERTTWSRSFSAIVALLGLCQIAAPYVLDFATQETVWRNAIISGVLLTIFGALAFFGTGRWTRTIVSAFAGLGSLTGLWLLISPFVLRYQEDIAAFWSAIIVGLLSFLLAGFAATKQPYEPSVQM